MGQNAAKPKDGNCRYLAAGKGISRVFSKIANNRFHFSRPPVSTAHPLLQLSIRLANKKVRNLSHRADRCTLVPYMKSVSPTVVVRSHWTRRGFGTAVQAARVSFCIWDQEGRISGQLPILVERNTE
jgi:hypothetical protein